MPNFSIRVAAEDLMFSAAHFITFEDGRCEPLHGHDYRVKAELFGPLGTNEYVVDFVFVKECLNSIVKELDHRVLLPGNHASMAVTLQGEEYCVAYAGRRWFFPQDNCCVLPIGNTTTEMFAQYLGQRLINVLTREKHSPVTELRIEVSECDHFSAVCRLTVG